MQKKKKRKIKRKTSIIRCPNCRKHEKVERSDAKYGSEICKKRESLFRIEKGYIHEIDKELKNGLTEFYNDRTLQMHQNPFKKEIKEFLRTKKAEEMTQSWKHEFDSFILYFFPNMKTKKYDIFYKESRKKAWEFYVEVTYPLIKKKPVYKNYDLPPDGPK